MTAPDRGQIPITYVLADQSGRVTQPWAFWLTKINQSLPKPGTAYVVDQSVSSYVPTMMYQDIIANRPSSTQKGSIFFSVDTGAFGQNT